MLKRYIIGLSFITCFLTIGQTQEDASYKWAIGLSAGDILHQLFNAKEENRSYAAFVIEYAGPKYAVQAGLRPGYNRQDISHEGFVDTEVTKQRAISGGLAITRSIFNDQKWTIRAGIKYDGGWSREDVIEDSGFDRIITRRLQWNSGLGLVADVRLNVHERISVGTEASLIYSIGRSELQQLFTNFPDFNTVRDIAEDTSLNVIEPATIYLRYHF